MKTLLKDLLPEWSRNCISYKALNKLTKPQDGMTIDNIETSFSSALRQQLEKVNNFFQNKYTEMTSLINLISERYPLTQNDLNGLNTHFDPYADEELLLILLDLLEIRDRAHKLFHFSNINKQGFVRVLKKFDKRLGKRSRNFGLETEFHTLQSLQFTSNSLFAEIFDSIERLLDYGQNVPRNIGFTTEAYSRANLTEEQNRNLINSICNDNVEDLRRIIPNLDNRTLTRCLYKAVHFRATQCVILLLDSGANIIIDDDINKQSLIHKLVIHGGRLPRDRPSQLTASSYALSSSSSGDNSTLSEDISLISLILNNIPQSLYATVSTRDSLDKSPLHYSSLRGFSEITRLLLEFLIKTEQLPPLQGFNDPSWFDNDGFTPLLYAVSRGHASVLDCFINAGISVIDPHPTLVNGHNTSNSLALHHACKFGHSTIVENLLACDVNPDIQNEEGESALHISARNGFHDCVRLLVGKSNLNIKENYYEWTPLFLAAMEGHMECVNTLLRADANHNVMDNSGWTPHEHAVFRGHKDIAEKLSTKTFEQDVPEPFGAVPTEFGHRYLQDQSLIIITLGSTSDTRRDVKPVELDNTSSIPLPLTSVSLVVSAKNATGGTTISLPVNKLLIEPISFYSSNIDEVILTFDLIPAYESQEQSIGRGILFLKTLSGLPSNPLTSSITVPILGTRTSESIGSLVFELLIINPFRHENLPDGRRTHWNSDTTKVIGHRGFGMNREAYRGENTILGFKTAASKGVEYVEFDVQLTRDNFPVIYHDWIVTETGYDISINHITLQQFLNLENRETGINGQQPENFLEGNGNGTIQNSFATLDDIFKEVPNIGFNIEIKYPTVNEAEVLPFRVELDLNLFVDKILECVYDYTQQNRNIIFSSFHPNICLMLAYKQPHYPVFFLTDGGVTRMADARCNSLKEAIHFAKLANLPGIVTNSEPVIKAPKLVKIVKEAGLLLFTYGEMNNTLINAGVQRTAGIDAIIVDSVTAIIEGFQQLPLTIK